ncbi:hypothetical protein TWF481_001385 [Arthrobotrys musiformis]|uniref:NB-ARC domain-containing protein n=1 Tax=Arthrobotrys musiformis TaxID=47236 RepID=A0AAV9WQP0_9PEZI
MLNSRAAIATVEGELSGVNMDIGELARNIAGIKIGESSTPTFKEGDYTINASGSGHKMAQGKYVEQYNLEGHARSISIANAGNYYENSNVYFNTSKEAEPKIRQIAYEVSPDLPSGRNRSFTGREEELEAISKFFAQSALRDEPVIYAITGTGGMGKTQIALEYAYREKNRFAAVFWVTAATEETVRTSFVKIMQQIVGAQVEAYKPEPPDYGIIGASLGIQRLLDRGGKVSSDSGAIDDIRSALFSWLKAPGNRKWLLIFDNADDLETFDLDKYFPRSGGGGILVTSRRQEFSGIAEQANLGGLDGESAVDLLLRLSQIKNPLENDKNHAAVIVKKLGFMPLAISHAGCFISQVRIPLSEYPQYYDNAFKKAQSRVPKLGWFYQNHSLEASQKFKHTAVTTWELSFFEIQKQDMEAASLLLTCSYLNPMEISEDLWEDEPFDEESQIQVKNRFSLLASYSLIDRNRAGAFSIHPVVHDWTRERVNYSDRLQVMGSTVKVLGRTLRLPKLFRPNREWDGREERRIMEHAEVLCKYLESRLHELLEQEGADGKVNTLWAVYRIASIFNDQGKHKISMQWFQRALAISEKTLNEDHLLIIDIIGRIAGAFCSQGKYDDAMQLYQRALASCEKVFGKIRLYHYESRIAGVLRCQGKYDDAMQWYQRAITGSEKALGENHPLTLDIVTSTATVFLDQAKYNDAMQWYQRALVGAEKVLDKDNPLILSIIHNIAIVFYYQDKYDDAMQWYRQALTGFERVFGKDDLSTLDTVNNIGTVFERQGQYDDAVECYQRALIGFGKILGEDHLSTLKVVSNIGFIFERQGKRDAIQWHQRALAGCERVLGKDHLETLRAVNNIAIFFNRQNKYDNAIKLYQRALIGFEKALGEDHPETLNVVNNISMAFESQGKRDAIQWYRRALAGRKRTLGKYHPDTLDTARRLHCLLANTKVTASTREHLKERRKRRRKKLW